MTCSEVPAIGLLDSGKELIREACREVGLRALESGNTAALERLKDLEIWKSIEQHKPRGGTFFPITGANEIDVILKLLALKQMKKRSTGYKRQGPTQSMNPEADSIESTKTLIGELLREGKSHEEICRTLDNAKRPVPKQTTWENLGWLKAYNSPKYKRAVKPWISRCRAK